MAPSSSERKKQPFVESSTPFLLAAFEATDIFGSVRSLGCWARREANLQWQLLKGPGWKHVCRERQRPGPAHQDYGQQLGSGQLCSGLNTLCACECACALMCACSCVFARVPVNGCVCACTHIQSPEVDVWCLPYSSIPLYLALQIFFKCACVCVSHMCADGKGAERGS